MSIEQSRVEKNKKKKMSKRAKIIWSIVAVVVLIGGGYALTVYLSFNSALKEMHSPLEEKSDKRDEIVEIKSGDPFSVLLLGIDERENDKGRTDTMILMTVNPVKKTIKMLSIPRDTRTEIVGHDSVEKINHAYAYGGIPMSIDTVEEFMNIPIDYYVSINMEGFLEIIDALGGVTLNNDMELTFNKYHFPLGEVKLTGEEALVFSRIRYEDPRGDFGRQIRQKQIIQAILKKGASATSLLKFDSIFDALGQNIKTNFTLTEMVNLKGKYDDMNQNIDQLAFEKGDGQFIGKLWYYIPNEEEVLEISNMLRTHLNLETMEEDAAS